MTRKGAVDVTTRTKVEQKDLDAPWDGWALHVSDAETGKELFVAHSRIEFVERSPAPADGERWHLTWRREGD